jgi:hypothetical protein
MMHHLTYEIDERLITQELEFWSAIGFTPYGSRRRKRGNPPFYFYWCIGGDHGHAIELLPVSEPHLWGLGHVAYCVPLRRWEIALKAAARWAIRCELNPQYYDFGLHAFLHSPSGHVVEMFTNQRALKAGPSLEVR